MPSTTDTNVPDQSALPLTEQVVRLQALLEASRAVHSTIDRDDVLQQAARIAVRELELEGAWFNEPEIGYGELPPLALHEPCDECPRFALHARDGELLCELVVQAPGGRPLSLYETDFLEGLALQTSVALENALNHQRHVEYARLARDLDAARTIQQSLMPQAMPKIPGYSVSARSRACYQVGGDYLDIVREQDGSHLMLVADVAGKGLASALVCSNFRAAFRALANQSLPLAELAGRLSQHHWEEGSESRRRYVTAIFLRLHPAGNRLDFVNAGHNPGLVLADGQARRVGASGTPLGLLPGAAYEVESMDFPADGRLLLYTDGLTEVFHGEDEFGEERLEETFRTAPEDRSGTQPAESILDELWTTLDTFSGGAPQQDDMSAIAVCRVSDTKEQV